MFPLRAHICGLIAYNCKWKVKALRRFRDRDFIRTREDLLFCVVGPYHPPDRVISYLKYAPAKQGRWGRGKKRFNRVMKAYTIPNLLETFSLLKERHPHYLFRSPVYNITMTAVPHECIVRHYKPEERLAQLSRGSRLDGLQKKLVRFASSLAEMSGVSIRFFGVTGSILLDIHSPEFSDLDLIVYGLKNCLAVKSSLTEAYSLPKSAARRLEGDTLKAWCEGRAQKHPLSFDEARQIYERKWGIGSFEDTPFSIHSVKLEEEVLEEYGDKIYYPIGLVTIRASVSENSDGGFLPAVYRVEDVEVVSGSSASDIEEVVSYEGLYSDFANVGEDIEVKGKLERVLDKKLGRDYHRVLVGSPEGRGEEHIKLV